RLAPASVLESMTSTLILRPKIPPWLLTMLAHEFTAWTVLWNSPGTGPETSDSTPMRISVPVTPLSVAPPLPPLGAAGVVPAVDPPPPPPLVPPDVPPLAPPDVPPLVPPPLPEVSPDAVLSPVLV